MIDPGYFEQKRRQLGMDRQDALEQIQTVLEQWYPGKARAKRLHQGILRIVTPSSSVAGDLRLRQVEFMEAIRSFVTNEPIERVSITIGA